MLPLTNLRSARTIVGTDPAAGSEISFTATSPIILLAVDFTFVTSATVASRVPKLIIDDGTNEMFRTLYLTTQTAGATLVYVAAPGVIPTTNNAMGTIPLMLTLQPGWRVRTSTALLDAGDNYSAPVLTVFDI